MQKKWFISHSIVIVSWFDFLFLIVIIINGQHVFWFFFFAVQMKRWTWTKTLFFVHFFMKIEWEKNLKQNEEWNDIKKGLSGNGNHHQSQNFHTHTHLIFMYRFDLLIFQPVRYVNCFKNVATTPFFSQSF